MATRHVHFVLHRSAQVVLRRPTKKALSADLDSASSVVYHHGSASRSSPLFKDSLAIIIAIDVRRPAAAEQVLRLLDGTRPTRPAMLLLTTWCWSSPSPSSPSSLTAVAEASQQQHPPHHRPIQSAALWDVCLMLQSGILLRFELRWRRWRQYPW